MKTGKLVANWSAHGGNVQSVSFTPDGRLLSGGGDGTTAMWSIEGKRLEHLQGIKQNDQVARVVGLYDSKAFVSSNWLGEVRFFETATGREITQVSSNPPKIVDRVTTSEKRLTELEPSLTPALAAAKAAEAGIPAAEAALAKVKPEGEPASKKLAEHEAKNAEVAKGLEYWQGMLKKAANAADKATATKGISDCRGGLTYLGQEIAKVKPAATAFRAAEAELARARTELATAQAKARDVAAEIAAHRERIVTLKAAQFNVGVLSESDKLAKLETDITDLITAKADNEAARMTDAARIESSRKTIAQNQDLLPKLEDDLRKLKAEFVSLDKTLSPLRLVESEAQGKIEGQSKMIEVESEAIVRLGQDRDAAVTVIKAAVEAYRDKYTTPLKARLTELTLKSDGLKKQSAALHETMSKAKASAADALAKSEAARQAVVLAEKTLSAAKEMQVSALAQEVSAAQAYAAARQFKALFSFHYFAKKQATVQQRQLAQKTLDASQQALGIAQAQQVTTDKALAAAKVIDQSERANAVAALAAFELAEKTAAPTYAELAAVTKERAMRLAEREKIAAGAVLVEKEYAAKLPTLQAALQKAKEGMAPLEKALAAVHAQLAEAAKPVEVKRLAVEAAAKNLELTKSEKSNAEKALAAAQKDIPQRDKNLEEIAQHLAQLQPQVEPMKVKVKQVQEQYFAMLPKREVAKKN
jgi:chromosome segregation ATPase